jgi:hypothetical protein
MKSGTFLPTLDPGSGIILFIPDPVHFLVEKETGSTGMDGKGTSVGGFGPF